MPICPVLRNCEAVPHPSFRKPCRVSSHAESLASAGAHLLSLSRGEYRKQRTGEWSITGRPYEDKTFLNHNDDTYKSLRWYDTKKRTPSLYLDHNCQSLFSCIIIML